MAFDPGGNRLPVGVVLRGELAAAGVKFGASGRMREGLNEQDARQGLAWLD